MVGCYGARTVALGRPGEQSEGSAGDEGLTTSALWLRYSRMHRDISSSLSSCETGCWFVADGVGLEPGQQS